MIKIYILPAHLDTLCPGPRSGPSCCNLAAADNAAALLFSCACSDTSYCFFLPSKDGKDPASFHRGKPPDCCCSVAVNCCCGCLCQLSRQSWLSGVPPRQKFGSFVVEVLSPGKVRLPFHLPSSSKAHRSLSDYWAFKLWEGADRCRYTLSFVRVTGIKSLQTSRC